LRRPHQTQSEKSVAAEGTGELDRRLDPVAFDDAVQEADAKRLFGGNESSRHEDLERDTQAHQAWQALRPAVAGNKAKLDFRQGKAGGGRAEAEGAGQRKLAAAAERIPLTMAIDGRPKFSIRENSSWPSRVPANSAGMLRSSSSPMSAPAQNALSPAPVKNSARASEASTWSSKAPISRSIP
jgi:hypothetical protein